MNYVRRTPVAQLRWPVVTSTTLAIEWSDAMAYIVGLTATDGCLLTGMRKINFKSNDRQLVELYLQLLGRTNRVREQKTHAGGVVYFTEFGDARLYRWFESIGLMPRKSLTLGAIAVPDTFLLPLVRGLLDGDGSIQNFSHRPTRSTYPTYEYERLWVFFASASRAHIDWLRARLLDALAINGYVEIRKRTDRHDFYRLKFGNHDSIRLLTALYPTDDAPRLVRKWAIWFEYRRKNSIS